MLTCHWLLPCKHLENKDTKGPVIGCFTVSFCLNDFRSQVVWSTTQCPRLIWNPLGEPEIRNFEVAVAVKKQVLGLQISVNDIPRVQVLQGLGDFCSVELGNGVRKALYNPCQPHILHGEHTHLTYSGLPQQREELAALYEIHHHVKILGILKCSPECDQEGVFDLR